MAGLFGGGGDPPPVAPAPPIPDRSDADIKAAGADQRRRYATMAAGRSSSIFAAGLGSNAQPTNIAPTTAFLGGSRA